MRENGFTLIELMVAAGVIALLAATGTLVLGRTFRSNTSSDNLRVLDTQINNLSSLMSSLIRESRVVDLDGVDRQECLDLLQTNGSSLTIEALDGYLTTYELNGADLASNSTILNVSGSTIINNLSFSWTCEDGAPDTVSILIDAESISEDGGNNVAKTYEFSNYLRNTLN
ncbi:prepilin-type N-terminal cleavage/methylation domain-containing protein [Candidatus Collierbacteria bacterium]|nr:prepilin-type N-terminal cleavage/methylation domain-containing protein [Candidatus Collierbacteria bacterium]